MRRIPVTRNFDRQDVIGYIVLREDVVIPPDFIFALGYFEEASEDEAGKIELVEVSLVPYGPAQKKAESSDG